jgi:hypothetical protein
MPFTAFGVTVGNGRASSGCDVAAVDRGADYFNAGFEAITTFEQSFASGSGDSSPGISNPGRDDGQRRADERRDQEDREDKPNAPVALSACQVPGGPPTHTGDPALFGGVGAVVEGNSGTTTLNVPVFLLPPSTSTVTVQYATTSAGSATPGVDFVATSGTLTFPPGSTTQNIGITVNGDTTQESNEIVQVTLSNAHGAPISLNSAFGLIQDDDTPVQIILEDASVFEGNSGTTNMVFTVSLTRTSSSPVTVSFQTVTGGTATAGTDYTAVAPTTVTIPAGEESATVNVPVIGDTAVEPNETVLAQISNPTGGVILLPNATGQIIDDDGPPTVAIFDESMHEGCDGTTTFTFAVQLSQPLTTPVTVNFTTANGTATAGSDYNAASGTVTFAPGQTARTIDVQVIGDAVPEPDETFQVTLTTATGATIADPSATGTIINDD